MGGLEERHDSAFDASTVLVTCRGCWLSVWSRHGLGRLSLRCGQLEVRADEAKRGIGKVGSADLWLLCQIWLCP